MNSELLVSPTAARRRGVLPARGPLLDAGLKGLMMTKFVVLVFFFGLALSASVLFLSNHINCMVMSDKRIVEHTAFVQLPMLTGPLLEWLCGTSLL